MARTQDYGLGEFTFPRGWFMVADAAELQDRPLSLRFFARDLVLYRGRASGKPALLDAYCPHMGTHLGTNTTSYIVRDNVHVDGDGIRCPYHGWRFRPDGVCDDIPGLRGAIPKAACVRSWTVHESMGVIWVWYDEEGLAPQWAPPQLPEWADPAWVHWQIDHLGTLPIHGQEVVDNIADMAHFGPIHGLDFVELFENEFEGHKAIRAWSGPHRTLVDGQDKLHRHHLPRARNCCRAHERPLPLGHPHRQHAGGGWRHAAWHALLVKSSHAVADADDVVTRARSRKPAASPSRRTSRCGRTRRRR
jgi:3-ketosteroid 9alpha-monooxygenase subunit A